MSQSAHDPKLARQHDQARAEMARMLAVLRSSPAGFLGRRDAVHRPSVRPAPLVESIVAWPFPARQDAQAEPAAASLRPVAPIALTQGGVSTRRLLDDPQHGVCFDWPVARSVKPVRAVCAETQEPPAAERDVPLSSIPTSPSRSSESANDPSRGTLPCSKDMFRQLTTSGFDKTSLLRPTAF